jgi:hypothetical protein
MRATVNLVHLMWLGLVDDYDGDVDRLHEMLGRDRGSTDSPEANLMLGLLFLSEGDKENAQQRLRLAKNGDPVIQSHARKVLRILKHPFCRLFEGKEATKIENFPWLLTEKL